MRKWSWGLTIVTVALALISNAVADHTLLQKYDHALPNINRDWQGATATTYFQVVACPASDPYENHPMIDKGILANLDITTPSSLDLSFANSDTPKYWMCKLDTKSLINRSKIIGFE